MSIPLQANSHGVMLPVKGLQSVVADSSIGAGLSCVSSTERNSGKLLLRMDCVDKSTDEPNKPLDQFQVEPSTPLEAQEAQTGKVQHSLTPSPLALKEKSVTTRESQTASATGKPALQHPDCGWNGHTDACWNSPLWAASNMAQKARLEDKILAGNFEPGISGQVMTSDGKYQFSYRLYHDKSRRSFGYSNNKVTRCADGKVLMDINRNFAQAL